MVEKLAMKMETKTIRYSSKKKAISARKENSYAKDFYNWTKHQASLLKKNDFCHLDILNLIEEIESLGRSDKRSLKSYLIVLLQHKLKLEYTPDKQGNSKSWRASIINAQSEIKSILDDSPSLKNEVNKLLDDAFATARKLAILETDRGDSLFPDACPWNKKNLL